jgi:hypothetical protein
MYKKLEHMTGSLTGAKAFSQRNKGNSLRLDLGIKKLKFSTERVTNSQRISW